MSKLHDRIKRKNYNDIDINQILGIDDSRSKLIADKMQEIFQNIDTKGVSRVQELIEKVGNLDFEPKEMFYVGILFADFLNNIGNLGYY
jgi:predicted HAD superfamily phosphohydrolase